jgi:hypothetical protein
MADDAYVLQGLNGFDKVPDGETFTATKGHSRGFQVTASGSFTYTGKSPKNATITFTGVLLDPPAYIGGPILTLAAAGGGEAAVFPTGTDYAIA